MYLCYDEAIKIGIKAYHELEYADSCCYAFRLVSRELKKYMENINLPYSPELAQQWINDSKEYWNIHKLKSSRKTLKVLADIMEHGCVTKSLRIKVERTPPYTQLPNWSKTLFFPHCLAMLREIASTINRTRKNRIRRKNPSHRFQEEELPPFGFSRSAVRSRV